jgi:hypothetical protein
MKSMKSNEIESQWLVMAKEMKMAMKNNEETS